jgi:hypothetical protein
MVRRFFKDSFSPTMAVAILALLVATSGTGYAAVQLGHGSVSSAEIRDHTVKPVDLKAAPAQPVLGPGQKMIGYFGAAAGDSTDGYAFDAITFPSKLPGSFNNGHVVYIVEGDPFTTRCPGPGEAKRGWMCFYEGQSSSMSLCCIYTQNYSTGTADFGTRIYWYPAASSNYVDGQWVVRAP